MTKFQPHELVLVLCIWIHDGNPHTCHTKEVYSSLMTIYSSQSVNSSYFLGVFLPPTPPPPNPKFPEKHPKHKKHKKMHQIYPQICVFPQNLESRNITVPIRIERDQCMMLTRTWGSGQGQGLELQGQGIELQGQGLEDRSLRTGKDQGQGHITGLKTSRQFPEVSRKVPRNLESFHSKVSGKSPEKFVKSERQTDGQKNGQKNRQKNRQNSGLLY